MIKEAVELVKLFHLKAGQPIAEDIKMLEEDRVKIRINWIQEEIEELSQAENIYEQVDATIDILYYLLGIVVEMGIPVDELFQIVHDANMKKLEMGEIKKREVDSKIEKPNGWIHPDVEIRKVLTR